MREILQIERKKIELEKKQKNNSNMVFENCTKMSKEEFNKEIIENQKKKI